ncbi:hypothetical protein NE237_020091 [Protea cynaroides]|uniref:Membrane-associated kinase regulator 6 n=1 Tax=Protea cynaroides TaxID=273540 RepID=A0A9Q0K1Z8_9MAGN|nr:hypothetical protein NE237_020091 [Protea cynaroides]
METPVGSELCVFVFLSFYGKSDGSNGKFTVSSLSIESFSNSWLNNIIQYSFENSLVDDPYDETGGFIELDPKWTPSKIFLSDAHDFSFNSYFDSSAPFIAYADELFSNGIVMPIFINPSKVEVASNCIVESPPPASISAKESSMGALIPSHRNKKLEQTLLSKYRRSSKSIFQKYPSFLKPLCQKFRGSSRVRTSRAESAIDKICGSLSSQEVSAQNRTHCSTTNWSDIDEAVLYCKNSSLAGFSIHLR